jgi:hypothetical protein
MTLPTDPERARPLGNEAHSSASAALFRSVGQLGGGVAQVVHVATTPELGASSWQLHDRAGAHGALPSTR